MHSTPPGGDPSSNYSRHVATRMLDFSSPRTPWPRRLWDVSSFFTLEELHEAGTWVDRRRRRVPRSRAGRLLLATGRAYGAVPPHPEHRER
ncbi:hypothetical protein AB0F17_17210 [Nonomuraea sp. NPDC026600]|uniref:hypothetical protein n=1 Tax=Nonomuraea sp. NPDC026600 TaxID=3155363 RepID=UPI0033DFF841